VVPSEISTEAKKDHVDVEVRTAKACAWTAESRVDWIRVAGRASGSGAGRVRIDIEKNDAPNPRAGAVVVAGHTVVVVQAGREPKR
jgi:hypothetical protein